MNLVATAHPRMQPGPGVAPEECKVAPRLKLEVTKGQNQVRAERGWVGPAWRLFTWKDLGLLKDTLKGK